MVVLYLLAAFGLAYGMGNKFAPALFNTLKIPRSEWRSDVDPVDSTTGPIRRFLVRLFACPYCTGTHASWIMYVNMRYGHEAVTYIFAGAGVCYLLDVVSRRFEK